MLQSHPIEVDGAFVGAAILTDRGYRFVAADLRLEPLDESTWPSLPEVKRLARHLFLTGRFPDRPPLCLVEADGARTARAGSARGSQAGSHAAPHAGGATLAPSFRH